MGNTVSEEAGGDVEKEDQQWLTVQNAALCNDSFVANVFDSLPKYDGTLPAEVNWSYILSVDHCL